jgi:hypothetical protein
MHEKSIFEHLLNGFQVPVNVLDAWVHESSSSLSYGGDNYPEKSDPLATWEGTSETDMDNMYWEAIGVKSASGLDINVEQKFYQLWLNIDNAIDAIVAEYNKRPGHIVLFGRDCWCLSLRMVQRDINHFYVEGASRTLMHNIRFKDMFTEHVPKPDDAILVDTGYEGSVPTNFGRAYGLTGFANSDIKFDSDCRIKLLHSDMYKSRQLDYMVRGTGTRYDFACFNEQLPKFFGRPESVVEGGFPELRLSKQASSAAMLYHLMEKAHKQELEQATKRKESVA